MFYHQCFVRQPEFLLSEGPKVFPHSPGRHPKVLRLLPGRILKKLASPGILDETSTCYAHVVPLALHPFQHSRELPANECGLATRLS